MEKINETFTSSAKYKKKERYNNQVFILTTRIKQHCIVLLSWIISLAKPLTLKFSWSSSSASSDWPKSEPSSNFLSLLRIYKSTPHMSKPPKLRCNHLFYNNNTTIPNCIPFSISTPWYQTMHRKKDKVQSKKSVSYCKDRIKLIIVII